MNEVTEKEIELICRLNERWTPKNIAVMRIGGKTNRNYRVQEDKGDWFVRIPFEGIEIVDRGVECQNVIALRKCEAVKNIVPAYHLYLLAGRNYLTPCHLDRWRIDLPDGTMVSEYIEGKELSAELLEQEEVQQTLVEMLHCFHTSGVMFVNEYDPLHDEAEKYKEQVLEKSLEQLVGPEELKEIERAEEKVRENLPQEKEGISTHNDLNFGNLRLASDGSIKLFDWEYAGHNIRAGLYYDYGTLLGENMLYREDRNPLTIEIFDQIIEKACQLYGKDFDRSKVYVCSLANVLVTFWWAIMRYFQSESQEEKNFFKDLIPKRLEQIRIM